MVVTDHCWMLEFLSILFIKGKYLCLNTYIAHQLTAKLSRCLFNRLRYLLEQINSTKPFTNVFSQVQLSSVVVILLKSKHASRFCTSLCFWKIRLQQIITLKNKFSHFHPTSKKQQCLVLSNDIAGLAQHCTVVFFNGPIGSNNASPLFYQYRNFPTNHNYSPKLR